MLERKFSKLGLQNFNYKKTGWYRTISNENREYKYNLIKYALLACISIVVVLGLMSLVAGKDLSFRKYLLALAFYGVLIILHVRTKHIKIMRYWILALPFVGLSLMLYFSRGMSLHRLIFAVYPLMCIQLRGTRRGSIWFAAFIAAFLCGFGLQFIGFIPPWVIDFSVYEFFTTLGSSLLVYGFSLFAEFRHEVVIGRMTDRFMFDETTGLPDKDVLINSIVPEKEYLFAIIKIENYSDLVALFGYEFSDTISQFASRKLLKYENRFHYKTYQLKYNEYGILIELQESMDVAQSAQVLNEVVKALEIESLPWESDRINLVYRVGASHVVPGDSASPLSKADVALKKAESGHSVFTIYEDGNDDKESAYDHVMKFSELITNRENDSFRAVFQPIFTGDGNVIAWYEALLRVKVQDGNYVSIYPYLSIAKSTGFYRYLTEFILRKSAEAIVEFDVNVSVNIAIHDIVRPEFILLVDEIYDMIRHKNGRIIFEILESDELVELDKCLWFIEYISRYGFKIAIDDFGTGYSNYCSLINLPIDIVKIDGSLIKRIRYDDNAKILVEGIVHFCEKSNKKTVAEFVEDKDVLDSLSSMGIDFLQGYYLAMPDAILVET